jgi:hypothetical protein
MKQHITPKQAEELTETKFYALFDEIVERKDWAKYHHKKVTIGKLIESIRTYRQIDITSKNEEWYIQLYKLNDGVKDKVNSSFECKNKELVDALFETLKWALNNK